MARISDMELERLKRETSLVRLCEMKGVELRKHGADSLIGKCPFHDDKTPSFTVSVKKNLWHCLGACRVGGSVIDFVMKAEGISFRHAVELLRSDAPLLPTPAGAAKMSSVRRLPSLMTSAVEDAKALADVVDYYHQTLLKSDEVLAYLEKRGLKDDALIRHFKLGYSNRSLGLRLPAADRKEGAAVREKLQRLGVLRASGHEHLNGSLIVPIFDEVGVIAGMYGRKVVSNLRPGTPHHLYLPGPHRAAFNSMALAGQETAIVCEAILDALSFWSAGFQNVIAAYGVDGFTNHHFEALKRHGTKRLLIAYDRDDAGDAAAVALARQLAPHGFECLRVMFPRGLDANAYATKVRPSTKALAVVLQRAQSMEVEGHLRSATQHTAAASFFAAQEAVRDVREPAAAVPIALSEGGALRVTYLWPLEPWWYRRPRRLCRAAWSRR